MPKKKTKKKTTHDTPKNMLPQNIMPIGDRVEENKNIYISQTVYKEIHKFTKNKVVNESGGILIGSTIEEFGKTNVIVEGFIESKYCEATPTTLKFTHETWEYVHKQIEKKYVGKKIVGWIHTHPDFGIFLSEYDKFIHQNFFSESYQIAYVIDPIQNIEGFYFWIDETLEKCNGFYIFDKTGVNINTSINKDNPHVDEKHHNVNIQNILIAILSIIVVFLIFSNISTYDNLEEIEKQQKTYANDVNTKFAIINSYIDQLERRTENIYYNLIKAGIIITNSAESVTPGAETPTNPTNNNNMSNKETQKNEGDNSEQKNTTDNSTSEDKNNKATPTTDNSVPEALEEENVVDDSKQKNTVDDSIPENTSSKDSTSKLSEGGENANE